jgi:uncharacterized protein (TIGR04222 family)
MFPFNLPGPQFLLFYAAFAAAVLAALYLARRRFEQSPPASINVNDPFLFACLRGGPTEVVRLAAIGLIDRGLLQVTGSVAIPAPQVAPESVDRQVEKETTTHGFGRRNHATESVRRQVERETMRHFAQGAELSSAWHAEAPLQAAEDYEAHLRRDRLVPDTDIDSFRRRVWAAAAVALAAVGGAKLAIATTEGRSNVGFLLALLMVAVIMAFKIVFRYRTAAGDSALASTRSMFGHLRRRASSIMPGSGSRELLWLTALFGAAALPAATFPFVDKFRTKKEGGSGCGSSCGGSGCGGNCGGGCGGCGG